MHKFINCEVNETVHELRTNLSPWRRRRLISCRCNTAIAGRAYRREGLLQACLGQLFVSRYLGIHNGSRHQERPTFLPMWPHVPLKTAAELMDMITRARMLSANKAASALSLVNVSPTNPLVKGKSVLWFQAKS